LAQRTIIVMLSRLRLTSLLPLAALFGCATVSTPPVTGTSSTPASGDYVITVAAGTANASIFTGNLAVSGNTVSGVFRYNNPGKICVPGSQDIAFTGNFGNDVMTLTSASFVSSVATLTINLPLGANSSGQQVASGTAVITGGTCALASTTAQAQYIPSLAGTWSGTVTGPSSGSASVSLTEAAANADGQFPITGAVSFTSSTQSGCNFSIPISSPGSGLISGGSIEFANASSTISVTGNAAVTPATFNLSLNLPAPAPASCNGDYVGTLTN
jgi:hypothetical protein